MEISAMSRVLSNTQWLCLKVPSKEVNAAPAGYFNNLPETACVQVVKAILGINYEIIAQLTLFE
jgi:hypothetical protein